MRFSVSISLFLLGATTASAAAQSTESSATAMLVDQLAVKTAVTGYEQALADWIHKLLPGSAVDRAGNVVIVRGSGEPRYLVACPLDEPGYVVGSIRDDGYLTLRRVGPLVRPLYDQQIEGQRVTLLGRRGPVEGVVAVRSVHLTRGRSTADDPFAVDDAFVDIGASSRREVEALGVGVLTPVTLTKRVQHYGRDRLAAPAMGRRAACAAVLSAASRSRPKQGSVVFSFVTEQRLGATGLRSVITERGPFDRVFLVDGVPGVIGSGPAARDVTISGLDSAHSARQVGLPVRFADSRVETVGLDDVERLERWIADSISGGSTAGSMLNPPPAAPHPTLPLLPRTLTSADSLLSALVESYGPSGMEGPVRDVVRRALPKWANPITDLAGNLWLDLGKGDPTVVFVAHLDEIGFRVSAIRDDGSLEVTPLGGFFPSLFEATPALVHGLETVTPGVFSLRDSIGPNPRRTPPALRVDLGTSTSAETAALGVTVGNTVTMPKEYTRLAGTRATGRSFDDRVGCTALLLAVRNLNPAKLRHRVIFIWSVREEIGLEGAQVVADALGTRTSRVHAIDTFVSADTPLELKNFGLAPLGAGPVARALDNSSVTPPAYVDSLVALARTAGIPLQVGSTNGGNDGSTFGAYGVPDVPIGWPLRYAHSPAEVIDLKDVAGLGSLVGVIANRW